MLISPCPYDDPDLRRLVIDQQREIADMEGDGHVSFSLHDGIEYLVGRIDGTAVACGALQELEPGIGEVKRMYVLPDYRGRGLSRAILAAVEDLARSRELRVLRVETGKFMPVALGLYASAGYTEIPLFGQYIGHPTSVCLEKRL